MGGRAFKTGLTRIKREEILPTLKVVASIVNMDFNYLRENMMGSCGKQADSGDIDIAVCENKFRVNEFRNIFYRAKAKLGEKNAKAMLKSGQINLSVPIVGREEDRIQVDFIYGPGDWLKFSHWSPGVEVSPWKGVFISQTYGVLAKMKVLYRYPENAVVDKKAGVDERLAEVAYNFNLETGLTVTCRMRDGRNNSFGRVDADTFETKCAGPMPPRVPRVGFITDPEYVVKRLVGQNVTLDEVDTFEKLLYKVRENMSDEQWTHFKERLPVSMAKSGARYFYEEEDLLELLERY